MRARCNDRRARNVGGGRRYVGHRPLPVRTVLGLVAAVVAAAGLSGCHSGIHAQAVATGLDNPTAFTVDPDGDHLWYSERFSGEIRRRNLSTGEDRLVWTVTNVRGQGEQGLFGLALHPGYPSTPLLFAYATRNTGFGPVNQVLRISLAGGAGTSARSIFNDSQLPGSNHVGGRILFGPDNLLYVSVGEHASPAQSQNLGTTPGKIHRMTIDGGVPAGNPFAGSTIWTFGLRNSFGFDFDPLNGRLWLTDNGPTCNDEVNRVVAGGNLAWGPNATCATPPTPPTNTNQDGPSPRRLPEQFYGSPIGITGAAFCDGCGLGSSTEDRLLVGAVNTGEIRRLTLDGARTDVGADTLVFDHTGPVLSLETRPGHPLYFSDFRSIHKLTLAG